MNKLFFIFVIFIQLSLAQNIKQCKERFDNYLNFKGSLNEIVIFENDAIHIKNSNGEKVFSVFSHEIPMLAEFFENNSYTQHENLLKLKGTKKYSKRQRDSLYIYIDDVKTLPKRNKTKPLQGYKIAIDPGHFGNDLYDAKIEQKYLYFPKSNLKNDSIKLFESELNYQTANILKKKLEDQGATVFLTREKANYTSFNTTYQTWLKTNKKNTLDSLLAQNKLTNSKYNYLINLNEYKFFWEFFRDYELQNRANKINHFNPHATIIIHYNVDEKNAPWQKPTTKNYTMCFIGGSFTESNLDKTESKIHFLRLLLTNQLNESEKLSDFTVQNFSKYLSIPMAKYIDADYLHNNALATKKPGVFSRNLLLCRIVNSPLVYGEALYQDNELELEKLTQNPINLSGINANKRLYEVAYCYFNAVLHYLKTKR